MIADFSTRLLILGITLLVVFPVVFAAAGYLWNNKYLPAEMMKGKQHRRFNQIIKAVNNYTFKEDTATLAKKAPKLVQKLLSVRAIHVFLWAVGAVGFLLTGNLLLLTTFPISFMIGVGRALPIINKRDKTLDRIFSIASSSIRFQSKTGKSVLPPSHWNHVQVQKWEGTEPVEMIMTFPSGNGPDRMGQRAFEKTFKENITNDHDWNYEWDLPGDKVTIKAVPNLPTMLEYPGTENVPWNVFPVGEAKEGTAAYDVNVFPHVLVGGPSGTGKSVLQRNIVFHTIQHNDRWRFLGVDLKRVELTPYNKYKKTVLGIATEVEQGLEVLKYAYNEMMDRYKMMEENGVQNLMELPDPPHSLLIMIDEATLFLGTSGSKTEEGKAEDAMKAEASDLVGKLLRLGRAASVHMLIAMQRPDATVLRGEYKANMDVRLAAGRMDSTPSSMILDSGEAAALPGIKGRGLIRIGGGLTEFQGYFAPPSWIDGFILQHPEAEPSAILPGGHLHDQYKQLHGDNLPIVGSGGTATEPTLPAELFNKDSGPEQPEAGDEHNMTVPPSFFNKETLPVPGLEETEMVLEEDDFVLDDFNDPNRGFEAEEESTSELDVEEVEREPEPVIEWGSVNPFQPSPKPKQVEQTSKPVLPTPEPEEDQAEEKTLLEPEPVFPNSPAVPAAFPTSPNRPAEFPTKPTRPERPTRPTPPSGFFEADRDNL